MKIVETDGRIASLEVDGVTTKANVSLLADAAPGDYVIVHAGFAIERLDTAEAEERIRLFGELGDLMAENADTG
jgi:hydrogenase expression/formation protein HypC